MTVEIRLETVVERLRRCAPKRKLRKRVSREEFVERMMLAAGVPVYVPADDQSDD